MLTADQRRQMLERIIAHSGIESMADLARKLGMTPQNFSSWRVRGTFNAELLAVTFPELSGDWLLTGEGPMLKADRQQSPASITKTDIDLNRALQAIVEEQRLTAKAQAQADKLLAVLHSLTATLQQMQRDSE